MSLYTEITKLPRDPIIGLTELFKNDKRTTKYNLGVGVYLDENSNVPVLESVKKLRNSSTKKTTLACICLWVVWTHLRSYKKTAIRAYPFQQCKHNNNSSTRRNRRSKARCGTLKKNKKSTVGCHK